MPGKYDWKTGLALFGAYAACTAAVKLLRVLYLWAELALGPVRVERFKGEWALVTGGSEGVGKAVAAALATRGMNIILVSRSQAKLDAAAIEITTQNPTTQVRTIATDLTAPGSCKQLLQQLKDSPITVLIANVGGGVCGPREYWKFSDQDEALLQDLNGTSCYSLVKGLLPGMVEKNKGAIVAVSSIMHHWGAFAAPYGAEKAKINALMATLDSELRLAGSAVTAQAMVLGPVNTPGVAQLMKDHRQKVNASTASTPPAQDSTYASHQHGESSSSINATAATGAASTTTVTNIGKAATAIAAEDVANAMVKSIGKGGPVITPYWRHVLLDQVMLAGCFWPPELQRAMQRTVSRMFKSTWDGSS